MSYQNIRDVSIMKKIAEFMIAGYAILKCVADLMQFLKK